MSLKHECAYETCRMRIPIRYLMCPVHSRRIPPEVYTEVVARWKEWRRAVGRGAPLEERRELRHAYLEVRALAIEATSSAGRGKV